MNRRRFLGATTLAAASSLLPRALEHATAAQRPSEYPTDSFDPWIEVHAPNLTHNAREVARAAGKRPILAVIKNNAYGLGGPAVARLLEPLPEIHGFAVVKLDEAVLLRDRGIKKPVLLMGPFTTGELATLTAKDIMPMVYTPIGADLERASAGLGRPLDIHVCVDMGLGRVGVPHAEAAARIRDLAGRKNVRIAGVMMTFTEDQAFDQEMLTRFEALTGELTAGGIALGRRHAASSYTFFQLDNAWLDMVRTGMILYGVCPRREVPQGHPYEPQARRGTPRPRRLREEARRRLERRLRARLHGEAGHMDRDDPRRAHRRLAARGGEGCASSHQQSPLPRHRVRLGQPHHRRDRLEQTVKVGDVATMFDWANGSRPEDVSAACGASVCDLLMHLNPVVPRYVMTEGEK